MVHWPITIGLAAAKAATSRGRVWIVAFHTKDMPKTHFAQRRSRIIERPMKMSACFDRLEWNDNFTPSDRIRTEKLLSPPLSAELSGCFRIGHVQRPGLVIVQRSVP
jgi:hypothetical protein